MTQITWATNQSDQSPRVCLPVLSSPNQILCDLFLVGQTLKSLLHQRQLSIIHNIETEHCVTATKRHTLNGHFYVINDSFC